MPKSPTARRIAPLMRDPVRAAMDSVIIPIELDIAHAAAGAQRRTTTTDDDGGDKRHPVTGCRADTLFGVWLYPPEQFAPMVDAAWGILERGDLTRVAEVSAQQREERDAEPLVSVGDDGIAELALAGPLTKHETSMSSAFGGTSMLRFREQLRETRRLAGEGKCKGVFIDADSWGGTAEGTAETAEAIRKTDAVVPVAFHAEDKAASGCLWLATQGRRFTGGRGANIGSQGAVISLMDRSENFKRQGLRPVIVSTGKYKAMGAPGVEISDEHRAAFQRNIDQVNAPFRDDVVSKRRLSTDQAAEVAEANIHVGADALRVGLIDAVCTREQARAEFVRSITTGAGGAPQPAADAPSNGGNMTAEQIARLKQFPGCEAATDANAHEIALAAMARMNGELTTARTTAATAAGDVTRLTNELTTAKAAAKPATAPEIIEARADSFEARMGALIATSAISKPLGDQIVNMAITPAIAANPTAVPPVVAAPRKVKCPALFADAEGGTVADRLVALFTAGAGAQVGTAAGAGGPGQFAGLVPQTGERVPPNGATANVTPLPSPFANVPDARASGQAQGKAYVDEQAASRGLPAAGAAK